MNYLALIMGVVLVLGLTDFFTARFPKLQRDIFYLSYAITIFLFVIRYYYGPDITSYVPYFEKIPSPATLLQDPDSTRYEMGYALFNSILHTIGCSYWGLTTCITLLYFTAIFLLLKSLPAYRTFALSAIVLIDYNLIYIENRQCLAVTFFIFMVLLLQHRKYLYALICAGLCMSMHKSGFLPAYAVLLYIFFQRVSLRAYIYQILVLALLVLMLLPTTGVVNNLIGALHIPIEYSGSIEHHLQLGRQIQVVALLYTIVLILVSYYLQFYTSTTDKKWIIFAAFIGLIIIVGFYQYYFLLNRIRSYFIPFIVTAAIQLAMDLRKQQPAVPYHRLISQVAVVGIYLYFGYSIFSFVRSSNALHSPITRASTIFDLRDHTPSQIRERQMQLAARYWKEDYMKSSQNRLR